MSKINILPKSVYNRIAAGEVVERPASVVKELVENSLDAGATEIVIRIERAGKQLISVTDNGSGIEHDDLQSAFMPHATSKISKASDLETIMTLGFRGEAVASISAVSTMKITSKVEGAKRYSLVSIGGALGSVTEAPDGEVGTDIRVEGLFFNTPVRFNFLKSDKAEEAEITTVVSRFILGYPKVAFTYYVNGSVALRSFGGGEDEAFVGVYGASVLSNCFKIDAEKHGIRVRGYIGNQNFYKANKSYQTTFLNGRYINNTTISAAMTGAYASYLMKRQYPFYVLYIDVPTEVVDVNVHPNKSDVRFANNNIIYGSIYSVVSSVLDGRSAALDYVLIEDEQKTIEPAIKQQEEKEEKTLSQSILEKEETRTQKEEVKMDIFAELSSYSGDFSEKTEILTKTAENPDLLGFATLSYAEAQKEVEEAAPKFFEDKREPRFDSIYEEESFLRGASFIKKSSGATPLGQGKNEPKPEKLQDNFPELSFDRSVLRFKDVAEEEDGKVDYFNENKKYLQELETKAKQNRIDIKGCTYVGKLFNTYLLYQEEDTVYFIDQHAAHERLIFDRLKASIKKRELISQDMLVPFELSLNAFEATFIRERLADIESLGFSIRERGETGFSVTAIPIELQNIDLSRFFNEILGDVSEYRAIKLEELLKDKLASAACKAAVKGGMELTKAEVEGLLKMMDGDMGLKCPHGRPVVVKMTKKQLAKMFKRIV